MADRRGVGAVAEVSDLAAGDLQGTPPRCPPGLLAVTPQKLPRGGRSQAVDGCVGSPGLVGERLLVPKDGDGPFSGDEVFAGAIPSLERRVHDLLGAVEAERTSFAEDAQNSKRRIEEVEASQMTGQCAIEDQIKGLSRNLELAEQQRLEELAHLRLDLEASTRQFTVDSGRCAEDLLRSGARVDDLSRSLADFHLAVDVRFGVLLEDLEITKQQRYQEVVSIQTELECLTAELQARGGGNGDPLGGAGQQAVVRGGVEPPAVRLGAIEFGLDELERGQDEMVKLFTRQLEIERVQREEAVRQVAVGIELAKREFCQLREFVPPPSWSRDWSALGGRQREWNVSLQKVEQGEAVDQEAAEVLPRAHGESVDQEAVGERSHRSPATPAPDAPRQDDVVVKTPQAGAVTECAETGEDDMMKKYPGGKHISDGIGGTVWVPTGFVGRIEKGVPVPIGAQPPGHEAWVRQVREVAAAVAAEEQKRQKKKRTGQREGTTGHASAHQRGVGRRGV